ncbi:hypothetical protein [Microbacterium sp. XT11]|uniref:hypothetical protein n=1 Tax=Microbacterium sp. XT11 TaxID=367477 RepID=UPI000A5204C1|nr:hypothetical protein [Microbacterium sp. XT11]
MTSGVGPEQTRGDGSTAGPGSAGEQPGSDRIGSARVVIGMASLVLSVSTLVLWLFVSRERDGLLLLATVFLAVFLWAIGAFTRGFWTR